jgi:hypothetical protein
MTPLLEHLLETGLLQFGCFVDPLSPAMPYRLRLEFLPSYPRLLQTIVDQALPLIGDIDLFLCTIDTLPFASAMSLSSGLPLVYSRGTGAAPTHDMVGAYDIGHPACLLANQTNQTLESLIKNASQVGIEVTEIISIVDDSSVQLKAIKMQSLIHLDSAIDHLQASQYLPSGQANAVRYWIETSRHPG